MTRTDPLFPYTTLFRSAEHPPLLAQMDREFAQSGGALRPLDRADMEEMLPGLGPQWVEGRHEPSCRDMDVAAIHQGFLSMARRAGAELRCDEIGRAHV